MTRKSNEQIASKKTTSYFYKCFVYVAHVCKQVH